MGDRLSIILNPAWHDNDFFPFKHFYMLKLKHMTDDEAVDSDSDADSDSDCHWRHLSECGTFIPVSQVPIQFVKPSWNVGSLIVSK